MFLIFSLGFNNIFPEGDLGFLKAISKLYNLKLPISERKLKYSLRSSKYRSA